jgi:hypothetical protein
MAENIVAGLFGLTPQMYGEQQRRSALREGIDLASLTPGEAGAAMTYAGARGLGGAIAGALGIEDPQLKLISTRNSIFQQIDQSNPESMLQGIKMLGQAGDQQGAMALADYYRKAQSEGALTEQRQAAGTASLAQAARERFQADPEKVRLAKEVALLSGPVGSIEYNTAYAKSLREQVEPKAEKDARFGAEREAVAAEMFDNKSFAQLTPIEKAAVNKRIEDERGKTAERGAPKVYTPGTPVQPKDWMAFDQNVLSKDPTMQRTSTILSDAPSAIDIIRSSATNDISAATLPGALARLTGEGKNMSNADVNRYARTGGLDDRLAQDAVKFFTGRTTDVKKDQAEKFAIALYRGALLERKKKLEDSAEQYGYSDSPNYKVALRQIDTQLGQFKLVKKGESAPTTTKTGDPLIDKYLFPQAESK